MPTVAHLTPHETRLAWAEYAAATRDLEGAEYDRAEQDAWERLQDVLGGVASATALPRRPLG